MSQGWVKHFVLVLEIALCTFSELHKVLQLYRGISTTVHATTKSFVPFCSAQDGESSDMNCLVF